jgi:hypothetical protein
VNIPTQIGMHISPFFSQISNVTKGGEHCKIDSTLIGDNSFLTSNVFCHKVKLKIKNEIIS